MILCVHTPEQRVIEVTLTERELMRYLWDGFVLADFPALSAQTLGAFYVAHDHWLKRYVTQYHSACAALSAQSATMAHVRVEVTA